MALSGAGRLSWRHTLGVAVVAALAWVVYARILGAYFRHDDFWWLGTARQWATGELPLAYAPAGVAPLYSLYYYFLYHTFGFNPRPYFLTLLACHVIDSCLVLALVWLLTERFAAGLTGGLLFAVLFCHHEAVTWPAGGPHVFACLGILLSLICWTLYRRGRGWCLPLAVLFALTATFTKDSGIAALPMLLALDFSAFRGQSRWPLLWLALPLVALATWRVLLPPIAEPARPGGAIYHLGPHLAWNLIYNVPQMLVPDLRFENYARLLERLLPAGARSLAVTASGALILLLSALAVWGIVRGREGVRLGLLWCYAGYLPFAPMTYDYARAPRYLYIPSVGLALLAGAAAAAILRKPRGEPAPLKRRRVILGACFVLYLLGSLGFARMVCGNRLKESALRRQIIATVMARVPNPPPGTQIAITGLPEYLEDVGLALPLLYGKALTVEVGGAAAKRTAYLLRFAEAAPGRLIAFRPPLSPASASGRTGPSSRPGG